MAGSERQPGQPLGYPQLLLLGPMLVRADTSPSLQKDILSSPVSPKLQGGLEALTRQSASKDPGVDRFLNLNSLAHPWSPPSTAPSLGGHLSPGEPKASYVYRILDGSPSCPPVRLSQLSVHHRSVHQHTLPSLSSAF